jgi:predicted NBD/HSP70 family sugar kinase
MSDGSSAEGETITHGAAALPSVDVDSYNVEVRDSDGFVGDNANKGAFAELVDKWRTRVREAGDDPLGKPPTASIKKRQFDKVLAEGDFLAAAMMHSAVEDFARQFSAVIARFLRLPDWRELQCIVVGGGLRAARVGELAVGRAALLLRENGHDVALRPIHHHPDEAGLVGCVHLVPPWILAGHDSVLAADIGGTNMRVGIVELNRKKATDLSAARVMALEVWRHADDQPTRGQAVDRLGDMMKRLIENTAKERLAPFIGIGCPGVILEDGTIERGGQNLPGNWEANRFNLPRLLRQRIPEIDGRPTTIVMHNDAVVQGLSEMTFMKTVRRWGVLTIGTGLGNACFSARR